MLLYFCFILSFYLKLLRKDLKFETFKDRRAPKSFKLKNNFSELLFEIFLSLFEIFLFIFFILQYKIKYLFIKFYLFYFYVKMKIIFVK